MSKSNAALYKEDNFSGGIVRNFSIHRIEAKRTSRIIGSPIETGTYSFDNKVIDPATIIVHGFIDTNNPEVDYESTINELKKMFYNRNYMFYSVSDGCNGYRHLIMEQLPSVRDVAKVDLIEIDIIFKEALLIQRQKIEASNSENSDIISHGYTSGVVR